MRFSVIIPTRHRNDALARCLERLAPSPQLLRCPDYEVIVTDDGSASTAEAMVRENFAWACWTAGPRRGPAANRNHGAAQGRGAWLAFVDDDCLPQPDWLAVYGEAIRRYPHAGVLEGRTLASGERPSIDTEAPVNTHGGYLWSCNFAIRRDVFESIGGFDAAFPGAVMEDVDLRERLRKQGIVAAFVPAALVHHPWRRRKGRRQVRTYVESVDYFLTKHPEQEGWFSLWFSFRVLAATIWRDGLEAFRSCHGRGIGRMAGLEFYRFALLAIRAVKHGEIWR